MLEGTLIGEIQVGRSRVAATFADVTAVVVIVGILRSVEGVVDSASEKDFPLRHPLFGHFHEVICLVRRRESECCFQIFSDRFDVDFVELGNTTVDRVFEERRQPLPQFCVSDAECNRFFLLPYSHNRPVDRSEVRRKNFLAQFHLGRMFPEEAEKGLRPFFEELGFTE